MRPAAPEQPAHVTQGLLERVAAGALDADYAAASDRRARRAAEVVATARPAPTPAPPGGRAERGRHHRAHPPHPGRRFGLLGAVALVLLGLMLAVAALHTTRSAEVASAGRAEIVDQVDAARARLDDLRRRQSALEQEVASLRDALLTTTAAGRDVASTVERLGVVTGARPATGPGLRVVVDDAPGASEASERVLDRDLQKLANALWRAGAEAISVNGQRLSALSAIRQAGDAITVNYRPLNRPYTLDVIGDAGDMQARFLDTTHGQAWFDLVNTVGLRFAMTSQDSVTVPASTRLELRFASPARRSAS